MEKEVLIDFLKKVLVGYNCKFAMCTEIVIMKNYSQEQGHLCGFFFKLFIQM